MGTNCGCTACVSFLPGVYCDSDKETTVWGDGKRDFLDEARRNVCFLLFGMLVDARTMEEDRVDEVEGNSVLSKDIFASYIHCGLELHC